MTIQEKRDHKGRGFGTASERSLTMQIPKRAFEKLMDRAKAKGEDRVEFTLDQLKKMSVEDSEKDKEDHEEETD